MGCPTAKTQPYPPNPGNQPSTSRGTQMNTTIEGKAILVTGANRGIGQAVVTEALRRGAARVYAGTRQPYTHPDLRVTALTMDITNEEQVQAAAAQIDSLDILV